MGTFTDILNPILIGPRIFGPHLAQVGKGHGFAGPGLGQVGGCRRIDGAMGGTGRQVPRPFHTEHIGGQALCI